MNKKVKPDIAPASKPINAASKRLIAILAQEFVQGRDAIIAEAMQIDGVDPKDGWRLDLEKGEYVKQEQASE